MIEFECPACNGQAQVPDNMAGSEYSCTACGALLEIPRLDDFGGGGGETVAVGGDFEEGNTIAIGSPVEDSSDGTISIDPKAGDPKAGAAKAGGQQGRSRGRAPGQGPSRGGPGVKESKQVRRRVCDYCGDFMTMETLRSGKKRLVCVSCRERMGDDYGRKDGFPFKDSWNASAIIDHTWNTFARCWPAWVFVPVAGGLLMFVAMFAMIFLVIGAGASSGSGPIMVISMLVGYFLCIMGVLGFQLGYFRMIADDLRGAGGDASVIFSQFPKAISVFVQFLAIGLVMGIPLSLVIGVIGAALSQGGGGPEAMILVQGFILLIYVLILPCFQALILEWAINDHPTFSNTLSNAFTVVSRNLLVTILWFFIAVMIFANIGIIGCYIGVFVTMPLGLGSFICLYLAMRNSTLGPQA